MRRLTSSLLLLTVLVTVLASSLASPTASPSEKASQFADQAPERLVQYIRIDTQNPPGNETRGVAFIAQIFDAAGIELDVLHPAEILAKRDRS